MKAKSEVKRVRSAATEPAAGELLAEDEQSFSIESRIIREFGERLVKHPEVALLELIKNAYDADAKTCTVRHAFPISISVVDDGHGMTLEAFKRGWMRIGTSSKESRTRSEEFHRLISGEKGIGRFAVRYLGRHLKLKTTAFDGTRGYSTTLTAEFDWPKFDRNEDLGNVKVPYQLYRAAGDAKLGTELTVTELRSATEHIEVRQVLTGSLGLLSPYRSLLRRQKEVLRDLPPIPAGLVSQDPGFDLQFESAGYEPDVPLADAILGHAVFRCVAALQKGRLKLRLYRRGERDPWITVNDAYESSLDEVYVDLRFFPSRSGTFVGMPVNGKDARAWIRENAGVAVFDRDFRVLPYGTEGDDWLSLAADAARNERNPSSRIAKRRFPMTDEVRNSTQLNYMLRLPQPWQLIGAVQVYGVRSRDQKDDTSLFVTADRQGFVENTAYRDLVNVVRGAAEVIAYADRELQLQEEAESAKKAAQLAKEEIKQAVEQIRKSTGLNTAEKNTLIKRVTTAYDTAKRSEDITRSRSAALEVMSLLGVVAGFMTHEFGTALHELTRAHDAIKKLARRDSTLATAATELEKHIHALRDFVAYSQGYARGTSTIPEHGYPARPRIQQVIRVFGKYAEARGIEISVEVDSKVMAPRVPVSLYGGIVLNLYTNALKALTSKTGKSERCIAIRAWNNRGVHHLQVSDTGVGIPEVLEDKIFDPLFTTTQSNSDPLGSGMGLGLTLVRRGAEVFGGSVNLVAPPPGFETCFEVKFPLGEEP